MLVLHSREVHKGKYFATLYFLLNFVFCYRGIKFHVLLAFWLVPSPCGWSKTSAFDANFVSTIECLLLVR